MNKQKFDVDDRGLAMLLERQGELEWPRRLLAEIYQNAVDQKVSRVSMTIEPVDGRSMARITVEDDDPDGFADLKHAWTLFAESPKKSDPEKRGRFDLGEKIVAAMAKEMTILSTTGGVRFDEEGRHHLRQRTECGSKVDVLVKMTREQIDSMISSVREIIPPQGITVTFNGEQLPDRSRVASFKASLMTEVADETGVLRRRTRKTEVRVYEPLPGQDPTLCEMGIPVVILDAEDDRFVFDVAQRLPLDFERRGVPADYLRTLRVHAANALRDRITVEDANRTWVRDAVGDPRAAPELVQASVSKRFGDKVVIYDPSDVESNKRAVSDGYRVIHGSELSSSEWINVKGLGSILPAGQVTPSPRQLYTPDGKPEKVLEPKDWTQGMGLVAEYCQRMARELRVTHDLTVRIVIEVTLPWLATWGHGGELTLNLGRLSKSWFDQVRPGMSAMPDEVVELMIHEFAHEKCSDHLADGYYRELCRIGAEMRRLGHVEREVLAGHGQDDRAARPTMGVSDG